MNTEMIPKEPVVKLLLAIKSNLDAMGKAALTDADGFRGAATLVCAKFSGKIEQYLESIGRNDTMHGMKSQKELADEEYRINLAKAVAMDACANEEYRRARRAAHERLMKAEEKVQAARKAYKEICEGD